MITLIYAESLNGYIGKDNKLPWHCKEDLIFFKNKTKDQIVLMGHNTYLSMKKYYVNKKMPFNKIYVATTKKEIFYDDVVIINDIKSFLQNVNFDLFIIGGKKIYDISMDYANMIYKNIIKVNVDGDTKSPVITSDFEIIDKKETNDVIYLVYKRVS